MKSTDKLISVDAFFKRICDDTSIRGSAFAAIRRHLDATPAAMQWIPVTERLPEDDSHVLAYLRIGEEGRIYPASYAKGVWWDCIFSTPATKTTTHWMPLPQPPRRMIMLGKCKMTGKEKDWPCPAAGCPLFGDCIVDYEKAIKKPQTNADRIRAMSDEELAKILNFSCPGGKNFNEDQYEDALRYTINWLKQPVEEESK